MAIDDVVETKNMDMVHTFDRMGTVKSCTNQGVGEAIESPNGKTERIGNVVYCKFKPAPTNNMTLEKIQKICPYASEMADKVETEEGQIAFRCLCYKPLY
jgi:hypothetical protein